MHAHWQPTFSCCALFYVGKLHERKDKFLAKEKAKGAEAQRCMEKKIAEAQERAASSRERCKVLQAEIDQLAANEAEAQATVDKQVGAFDVKMVGCI